MSWFGLKSKEETPAPKQISLGKSGGFRYDPVKKKYVFDEDPVQESKGPEGPPPMPVSFTRDRTKGPGSRYADVLGASSFSATDYKPSNSEKPDEESSKIISNPEVTQLKTPLREEPDDFSQEESFEPKRDEPELTYTELSEIEVRLQPISPVDDAGELRQLREELAELKQNYSMLKVSYHDTVNLYESDIEQLQIKADMLNDMKIQSDAEVARLQFEMDSEQSAKLMLELRLNKLLEEAGKALHAITRTEVIVENEPDQQVLLKLARSEMENVQLKSNLHKTQDHLRILEGEVGGLKQRLEMNSRDLFLTATYKDEELIRLSELYSATIADLNRVKFEHRQDAKLIQTLQSDLEASEMKVSIMSEAKIKAEIEGKKYLFDKTQLEQDYEALLQKLRHEDAEKNRLADEMLSLKYSQQARRAIDDEKLNLQKQIQEADMERLSMQRSNLEYRQEIQALTRKLNSIDGKASLHQTENESLKKQLESRLQDIEHLESELRAKSDALNVQAEHFIQSQGLLQEKESQLAALRQQHQDIEHEQQGWQVEKEGFVKEIADLNKKLNIVGSELESMGSVLEEKEELENKIALLSAKLSELADGEFRLSEALKKAQDESEELRGKLEENHRNLAETVGA
eukprot:CAMPEP_0204914844 /NCGR_PEP_ID=MMETSP1397-20131031/12760_1 /ASSEMBLY_ACC=CAM_ASM_000891 /TAXON_ID=49980 /ORGANISM="Climacostomum Climacostomum virens, Strain Stock W-24" /LENGTH=631 /DNA_ID=CAMNT_0052086609 /DNA_START=655 /DNA_END=2546 /DNA_ORIENTATION=+